MLKYSGELDLVFQALGDPTRRALVARLAEGPASVSDLAAPLTMSLPAVHQHLRVLEESGLVTSRKVGRVRTCQLQPKMLDSAETWIQARKAMWERRLDRLGAFLAELPADDTPRTTDHDNPKGQS